MDMRKIIKKGKPVFPAEAEGRFVNSLSSFAAKSFFQIPLTPTRIV